jgi:preprotein translocase subunit YajC
MARAARRAIAPDGAPAHSLSTPPLRNPIASTTMPHDLTTGAIEATLPTATFPALLLQDGPPVAGTPLAPAGGTAAPGGAGGAAPQPQGGLDFITLLFIGILLALIVSTVLGGRREKKRFEQMMASIKKNDQVRTSGGIIGSVVEVKPDVVILKVDENSNTKITVARGKIEAVLKETTTAS